MEGLDQLLEKLTCCQAWWLTAIIPASQEAELRIIV
jgi:hypothetical protein